MNTVNLIGRLTKDPEMSYTPTGVAVAKFVLAVNRPFKNQNGEYEADFIIIQTWRRLAENVANYTKKGSRVGVVGRIQTRNFENDQGQRVYVTEVVADSVQFLDPANKNENNNQNNGQNQTNTQNENPFSQGEPMDIDDQDLPF